MVKKLPPVWDTWVWPLGQEDPLGKEMATHSSILAWGVPWTEEPGGLQSMELQRVRHNLVKKQQFITLTTSNFWLYSEVLREDILHLLAICSPSFSLATFILLAKSLACSAASFLFCLMCCFFRAIHQCLCCITWCNKMVNVGSLVLSFFFV